MATTQQVVQVGDTLIDGRGVQCVVDRVSTPARSGDRSVLLTSEHDEPRQVWLSQLTSEYARA